MIKSFKNRALRQYWTKGETAGLRPDWQAKNRNRLNALDRARSPAELDVPGFGFHTLKRKPKGRFALSVSRNWRLTFGWEGEDAVQVDMEDCHGA
jgi:proteic killer suppression protein